MCTTKTTFLRTISQKLHVVGSKIGIFSRNFRKNLRFLFFRRYVKFFHFSWLLTPLKSSRISDPCCFPISRSLPSGDFENLIFKKNRSKSDPCLKTSYFRDLSLKFESFSELRLGAWGKSDLGSSRWFISDLQRSPNFFGDIPPYPCFWPIFVKRRKRGLQGEVLKKGDFRKKISGKIAPTRGFWSTFSKGSKMIKKPIFDHF